jgi:hypothetical protein
MKIILDHPYNSCIEACNNCTVECEHCATECLKENDIKILSRCIALTRECAIVCDAAARLMSVGSENAALLCASCYEICTACAEECESDSKELTYCKSCAEACRICADECGKMAEHHHSAMALDK